MLVQTNSYIVPASKRQHHARLMRRFRQALARMGCEQFEVLEEADGRWAPAVGDVRFVQIMRFRDRQHHISLEAAERSDKEAQLLIREFAELIDLPGQTARGQFAVTYYLVAPEAG
jgi:hypothetical protein